MVQTKLLDSLMYMCTEVEKLTICEDFLFSFYCLQSLFIPPGWSPNVPCRHTDRCCIWRSPFSILYIFALDCGGKVHITATVAHTTVCPVFLPCQNVKSDKLKKIQVRLFLLLCERLQLRFIWPFLFMWINLFWAC